MKQNAEWGVGRLSAFTLAIGMMSSVPLAYAQDVAPAAAPDVTAAEPKASEPAKSAEKSVKLEKVQVTGSRIKSPNLTSSSPITTVGAAEVKAQGTTRVEDLLNSLPQVFADQGGNLANGATGTATVDLRDLGSSRTLVLIDGKRVQPGDPGDSTADLNFIPAALIERVDVLTGGASSTYGADAVAGVVNFIMRKDFQGVRLEAQRGIFNHKNDGPYDGLLAQRNFANPSKNKWDGQSWDLTGVIGTNTSDGKGNITAYATYRQIDPIDQGQRDFSACSLGVTGAAPNQLLCAGSSTNATGRFLGDNGSFTLDPTGPGNTFRPYVGTRDAFNFNPFNYFQRNDERYTLGAFANYEFNANAEAYAQFMFMDDRTNAVIAPSGAFFGNDIYTLSRDNPLISDSQEAQLFTDGMNTVDALIGRRNIEGGPRDSDLRHTSYRILGGVRGDLIADWTYDASYQFGKTIRDNIYRGEFSRVRTIRALDVVSDPTTGAPVCQSVLDGTDPNCVPYNIFQVGGVTPAALNYLTLPGFANGIVQERVASAFVSGPVGIQSPFATEQISLAIGVEYRDEEAINEFDSAFQSGDLAGQGGASLNSAGAFDVKEIYGELKLPIWQDQPFGKELSVDLGYRYSDYSSIDATDAYKLGLNYAPTEDVKARFSYNRAVRAPNIGELSQPTNVQLDGSTDPCSGAIDPATGVVAGGATAAQCANDPLIANNPGLYGTIDPSPASQYNGQVGTSPGLAAEEADTVTAGLVFTPTFLKGFSASVDFYTIKVDGFISTYGADTILQACYERGQLCELINRDSNAGPTFGSLWLGQNGFVIDTTQNTGQLKVSGIDFKADYRVRGAQIGLPDAGTFVIDYVGSLLLKQEITPIPGDSSSTYQCKGKYGTQCGAPVNEYRHKLRNTWQVPWFDGSVSLAWRYFDGVKTDGVGTTNGRADKLKPQSYFDLVSSVRFDKKYTVRLGVNNVLDNDPPIVNSENITSITGSGNTYPQVYDALGRFIFSSVTLDF